VRVVSKFPNWGFVAPGWTLKKPMGLRPGKNRRAGFSVGLGSSDFNFPVSEIRLRDPSSTTGNAWCTRAAN
jgi:hypothetical protein